MTAPKERGGGAVGGAGDIAVAVGYTPGQAAPIVLAKGKGELAKAIREIAASCGVSVLADPELAEGLVEIDPGAFIPEEYYRIVAELLVFVGRVSGATGEEVTAQ
jgi:flagellar biosynthesis protein FlhB